MSHPGADGEQIEKEYLSLKPRLAAAKRAADAWDHRTGIAPLREEYDRANNVWKRAVTRMARMKPTTSAGAGALIAYLRRDVGNSLPDWSMTALKTVARALTRMEAA